MARKQSKSGTKKKRKEKRYGGPGSSAGESAHDGGGGAMQNMVGGFRRAVGVEKSKSGRNDVFWTILLVLVVAAILFWRFAG